MPKHYPPGEHPRYKEFKNKNPTREDVQVILQHYDDGRIRPLADRIAWLELPLWRRALYTIRAWWHERTHDEEGLERAEQMQDDQMAERVAR